MTFRADRRAAQIYDWNRRDGAAQQRHDFQLLDETLRDGLQSPSVVDPPLERKVELLELMAALGIGAVKMGLPGAGPRVKADVLALTKEVARRKLSLDVCCAARTVVRDIEPIVDIVQASGVPVEVYTFIGSSPMRLFAEKWSIDTLLSNVEEAIGFTVRQGLRVALVVEDTTRSRPEVLEALFRRAINLGARRLCLCDTAGHSTPEGVLALFDFAHRVIEDSGESVRLDWHGHNDRGLALVNAMAALRAGAHRAHATVLGVGERVGNTAMEQLLLNLRLDGLWDGDLSRLGEYCEAVADAYRLVIPFNTPVCGRDAFRTATGVHAAAILKAQRLGEVELADLVYSAVPAKLIGREQVIDVGPMSGASNVVAWLEQRGVRPDPELVRHLLAAAKQSPRVLTNAELNALLDAFAVVRPLRAAGK